MKAKIDNDGNLFVNKGNGFQPQVCIKDFSLQCCMACPHFGEPKLVGGVFSKHVVRIEICDLKKLEFESLYFEKTCIRLRAPLQGDLKPDDTVKVLGYWLNRLRELEDKALEADDNYDWGESIEAKKEIDRIKAYHIPDNT